MNQEVFTPQQAVIEATRCLMCHDAPCQQGCPAGVDVPSFIRNIKTRNFAEANRTIKCANVLSGTCAQVCPVNEQCQEKCSQRMLSNPISIGKLQAFAASCEDKALPIRKPQTGKKVALVGGGPASLACAFELIRQGVQPVIFERNGEVGGMLTQGIPNFRLSRDLIKREVKFVEDCGARIETGKALGKDISLQELTEKYDAVFLGFGASEAKALEGKKLDGVVTALDYLAAFNSGKVSAPNGPVIVVGGGNTAMDAATAARSFGGKVTVLYRRTEAEMPAWKHEIERARAMGVEFLFLAAPVEALGSSKIEKLSVRKMAQGEPDASGRRRPVEVPGSDWEIPCSLLVYAISQGTPSDIEQLLPGIELTKDKLVKVNEGYRTSHVKVFAGGDLVNGGKTVVRAVFEGKSAGAAIARMLEGNQ